MECKRKIVCKICGKEAYVPQRRKKDYCDDLACKKAMYKELNRQAMERYVDKQKGISDMPKTNIQKTTEPQYEKKVNTEAVERVDISDILELARQFDACRLQLIQLIEKERRTRENFEKAQCTYNHAFEFEDLTKDEVWEVYQRTKEERINRRQSKYRYSILKAILDSIEIKRCNKFVVQAIQGCKTTRDFDDYIQNTLRKDEELFKQK